MCTPYVHTQHEDQELWARYDKVAILHTWSKKADVARQKDIHVKQLKTEGWGEREDKGPSNLSISQPDSSGYNFIKPSTRKRVESTHATTPRTSLCGRPCMMWINLMKTLQESSCSGLHVSLGSSRERMSPVVRGVMIWKALDWRNKKGRSHSYCIYCMSMYVRTCVCMYIEAEEESRGHTEWKDGGGLHVGKFKCVTRREKVMMTQ